MKNKIILTIAFVAVSAVSYFGGTTHAKTETIKKEVATVPNGYINTNTEDFYNNYIDLRTVNGYSGTANG